MNSPSTAPTIPGPVRPKGVSDPLPSDSTSDTYITSLSLKERKAYLIAKSHLDMSFELEKSIGFKQFLQKNK